MPTPNIQKLAEEGVLFRKTFCGGPTCSPSRAVLLTGQYAHNNGMLGLAHRGFKLNDYNDHIIYTLKKEGYHTELFGMQHIASNPEMIGYDKVDIKSKKAVDVLPKVEEFLDQNHESSFFISVGFFETHRPFPTENIIDNERYEKVPDPLPDTPEIRKDMTHFKKTLREYDRAVGEVIKYLKKNNLYDNTLIINTTDHGIAFPKMKCNLTDHGIGVMLIMKGPNEFAGGKVVDSMISQIDVFPTICEYLGIEKPSILQGKSFMPIIHGEKDEINDEIFSEVTFHAAYEPMRAVRTKKWKYIKRFSDTKNIILPNIDKSISKSYFLENGLKEKYFVSEELYDLVNDPHEACNLVENVDYVNILEDMSLRLDKWMTNTNDPILSGIKLPKEGVIVNDINEIDPEVKTAKRIFEI